MYQSLKVFYLVVNLLYKFLQISDENVHKETSIDSYEYLSEDISNQYVSNNNKHKRKSKRCDIMLKSRTSSDCFVLDVSQTQVYSPDKSQQLSLNAAFEENRAMKAMINSKIKKYNEREIINNAKLIVCGLENSGRISSEFKKLINDTIDKNNPALNTSSINYSAACLKNYWAKRFSFCFHKTNAMNLLKQASNLRVPSSLKYDEANKYSEDFLN